MQRAEAAVRGAVRQHGRLPASRDPRPEPAPDPAGRGRPFVPGAGRPAYGGGRDGARRLLGQRVGLRDRGHRLVHRPREAPRGARPCPRARAERPGRVRVRPHRRVVGVRVVLRRLRAGDAAPDRPAHGHPADRVRGAVVDRGALLRGRPAPEDRLPRGRAAGGGGRHRADPRSGAGRGDRQPDRPLRARVDADPHRAASGRRSAPTWPSGA